MNYLKHYHKTLLVTFFVVFLSLANMENIQPQRFYLFKHADKVVHFLMYFGITIVFLFEHYIETWKMQKRDYVMNIYPLLLGGFIEIIQTAFMPYRSGEWYDLIANISGIFAANLLFYFIKDVKLFIWLIRFPFRA